MDNSPRTACPCLTPLAAHSGLDAPLRGVTFVTFRARARPLERPCPSPTSALSGRAKRPAAGAMTGLNLFNSLNKRI